MRIEEELKGREVFENAVTRFEEDLTANMSSLLSRASASKPEPLWGELCLKSSFGFVRIQFLF